MYNHRHSQSIDCNDNTLTELVKKYTFHSEDLYIKYYTAMTEIKKIIKHNIGFLSTETKNINQLTDELARVGIITVKARVYILKQDDDVMRANELYNNYSNLATKENFNLFLAALKKSGNQNLVNLLSGTTLPESLDQEFTEKRDAVAVQYPGSSSGAVKSTSVTKSVELVGTNGKLMQIGKISYDSNDVIGRGSMETVVFKGLFEKRTVAVKKILLHSNVWSSRETDLLQQCNHENVIWYYCQETDKDYCFIVLDLCLGTLADWVENKLPNCSTGPHPLDATVVMKDITLGIEHLHDLKILHRDLKPSNVLIREDKNHFRVVVSDFGISKQITGDTTSITQSQPFGSQGWVSPEVLRNMENEKQEKITRAVDIFSLGCLFYFVLTKGSHPFGELVRRQSNVLDGKYFLKKLTGDSRGADGLIRLLISPNPKDRPTASAILFHPLLWTHETVLEFFRKVSAVLEVSDQRTASTVAALETDAFKITGLSWMKKLSPDVVSCLEKRRLYKSNSVQDLIRALRNMYTHYDALPDDVKNSLGEVPEQFAQYWLERFPLLLTHAWRVFQHLKSDDRFSRYYSQSYAYTA